ncbi:MAG: monovalent cation/H+ antiporter complex subunit F [Dehalococcoidia bacterium]
MEIVLNTALGVLAFCLALCAYRVVRGPTMPDRLLGVDALALNVMGIIAIVAVLISRSYYNAVLVIAVLIITGSIAVAKYLVTQRVIDSHDHRRRGTD